MRWRGFVLAEREEVYKALKDEMLVLILLEVVRKPTRPRRTCRWHGFVLAGCEEVYKAQRCWP